jgi:hypothetical protein
MHAELVVPALLPERAAVEYPPMPALERLLARGRRSRDESCSYEQWLAEACGLGEAVQLAAGALTLLAEGGAPGDAVWMRADPVHLRLGRVDLSFVPAAAFELGTDECNALAQALNRQFAGEFELLPVHARHWCARLADMPRAVARSTAEVAGLDVDANLPKGDDATLWHARLNEVQMLLHDHAVNQAREVRGLPVVNSLWFWGAGTLPAAPALRWDSVSADEPVARGCALRVPLALGDAAAWQACLVELETRWFAPLLAALRAGRIGMLTLQVPDARESLACETVRGDLRRIWRRARALAAYA